MTYDIIENISVCKCTIDTFIGKCMCLYIASTRIENTETLKPTRPLCIKSSYRGNPLSKTEQNMFLEVMVYGKCSKKSWKYTHCCNSK